MSVASQVGCVREMSEIESLSSNTGISTAEAASRIDDLDLERSIADGLLESAASYGNVTVVHELLKRGVDPDVPSDDGVTALEAIARGYDGSYEVEPGEARREAKIVRLLDEYGASACVDDPELGRVSAAEYALRRGHSVAASLIRETYPSNVECS